MIQRLGGLVEAEVDGELVALHVENGKCYGFNGTATHIWHLLEKPKSLSQLCADLAKEFQMPADTSESEVMAFLRELEADGLVKLGSCAATEPAAR